MTRRDAYLAVWGACYIVLAAMTVVPRTDLWPLWAVLYGGSGIVSVTAAVTPWPWLPAASFCGLTGAAAARAAWHLVHLIDGPTLAEDVLGALLWATVAAGQVVVSGWPVGPPSRGRGL